MKHLLKLLDLTTEEIEEILVMGDIGINTTTAIISNLKMEVADRHIKETVRPY